MVLHWIINPGLMINELILGQRVPKVMLIEKDSKKSLAEKSFIPCPHCGTFHSGLEWSPQNKTAFKNWFGLYCNKCEGIIPCVRNLTSLIILVVTFPFWYWFKDKWKENWLKVQKQKFSKPLILSKPEINIWTIEIQFGVFLYILNVIVFPLFDGSEITPEKILIGIPIYAAGGFLFGWLMKLFMGGSGSRKTNKTKFPG